MVRAASREAEIEDSAKGKTCFCVPAKSAWCALVAKAWKSAQMPSDIFSAVWLL